MENKTFSFGFADLKITPEKIAGVMGYDNGPAPEPFHTIIEEVLQAAPGYCEITGGYTIRKGIRLDRKARKLHIDEISFDIHRIITDQVRKAEHIALFLCTAGAGIGNWSKELMKSGDMIKGYVADVVGSEAVESAMDRIQDSLEKELEQEGYHITERYSPGYCEWHVSDQQKLFSFFPRDYCGIRLSPSSLMDPIKSVSGIIGIGREVKRNGYACNLCDMKDCLYRNKRQKE